MKKTFAFLIIILSLASCRISIRHEIQGGQQTVSFDNADMVDDQATISDVALNDPDPEVRKSAISKLTLQSTLSGVALNDQIGRASCRGRV